MNIGSTTVSTAISSMFPAVTFLIAIVFRIEKPELHNKTDRLKISGTILSIAGAVVMSLYHGKVIEIWRVKVPQPVVLEPIGYSSHTDHSMPLSILYALGSCISTSVSIVIEGKLLAIYKSQLCASAIKITIAAIQCGAFAVVVNPDFDTWKFFFDLRGAIIIYSAAFGSGLFMIINLWCITKKGHFFISMFSPLSLLVVGIFSPLILNEDLHLGTVLGGVVLVCGIYLISWGSKANTMEERRSQNQEAEVAEKLPDIETSSVLEDRETSSEGPTPQDMAVSQIVLELKEMVL